MPEDKITFSPAMHRQLGVDLFNYTWTLIDKGDRTPDEAEIMVHAAHASAYHWRQVGKPLNFARSDWQISRVYAVLNRPEAALYHAQHCLEICEAESIGDFDLAFAYEALARSYAIGRKQEEAQKYLELARQAGEQIKKKDDRSYFLDELDTIDSG
ncbi:MAG: tetratricopeptide repeat protein [Candidatus Promineifilaceae bacterium]